MGANNQVKTVKMNKAYFLPDMLTCENEEEEEEDPHACGSETQSSTTNDDEDHENHDRGEEEVEDSRNNSESREEGGDNAIDTGDNANDSDTELATKEVHHDHGVHAPRAPKATKSDYAVGVASTILEETTLADALGHCNGVCNTTTTTNTTTAEATMGATNSTTVGTDLFESHEDVSSQEEENDKAPPIANMSAAKESAVTEPFQSHENLSSQDQQEEQQEQEQEEAPAKTPQPPTMIEERGELSSLYVGRIIGKGGEMIRDLQARSGCHIDVDQNVPVGEPRIIVYRGESVVDVEFAKRLVDMLCTSKKEAEAAAEEAAYRATTTAAVDCDGHYGGSCGQHSHHGHGHHAHHHLRIELPLGKATLRRIQVPKALIGKIIGRGGEMIRELQSKSHARIQVDHAGEYTNTTTTTTTMGSGSSSVVDGGEHVHTRQVTVTGTEESVEKAVDMIGYLMTSNNSNRGVGGEQRQLHHHQNNWSWDSSDDNVVGPSSSSSQQGQHLHGVQPLLAGAAAMGNDPYWIAGGYSPGQKQSSDAVIGMGYHDSSMGYTHPHHPQGSWNATANQTNVANTAATAIEPPMTMMIESDIVPCAKKDVGHIIGRKGATINDLQRRSSCNIQIDQKKYEISITGYRHGIEMAKSMLQQIVERGCTHPYAGGGGYKQAFSIGSEEQQQREREQQREPSYLYQHQHQQNVTVQQQQQPPHSPLGYADHQHQQQGYHQTQDGYLNQHHDQYNQQHHYEGMVQTNQNMQDFYGGQHPMPMMMMYQQPPQQQQQQQYPAAAAAGTQTAALSDSPWIAASTMDGRIYYYNQNTMETRWDGPQGME